MSSEKKISTNTLSLRFMQNAQRAKNVQQVELEKAKSTDDGEWEVSQEVKDAWGIGSSNASLSSASSSGFRKISYEGSYLPFLFSQDEDSSPPHGALMPRGRRNFNKLGKEMIASTSEEQQTQLDTRSEDRKPNAPSSKLNRPKWISGTSSSSPNPLTARKKEPAATSAREIIYDTQNVGTDLRSSSKSKLVSAIPPPTSAGFLKPAGVDEPVRRPNFTATATASTSPSENAPLSSFTTRASKKRDSSSSKLDNEGINRKKKRESLN